MLVRELRERVGLTQVELAVRAGLSASTIHKLETGRGRRTGYATLRLLARALDVPVEEIEFPAPPTE